MAKEPAEPVKNRSKSRPARTKSNKDIYGPFGRYRAEPALTRSAKQAGRGGAAQSQTFFESPAFNKLITRFKKAAEGGPIDQDMLWQQTGRPLNFTLDEFQAAFDAVMSCAPAPTEHGMKKGARLVTKTYRGLDFSALIGQGSQYRIQKSKKHPV